MGTKILDDIRNDIKLLITGLTGFEENEEGFHFCERFALSQIKHHRYLSVNSHETKRQISEVIDKFAIHGKYDVAHKFKELVDSFLKNFDFERHPQYDLQWSLLTFLMNLASETCNSSLSSLNQSISLKTTVSTDETDSEEIDWAQYLKEGQLEFFCNYESDSESEWSNIEDIESFENLRSTELMSSKNAVASTSVEQTPIIEDKLSKCLVEDNKSKQWLETNIQNSWWNELDWNQCQVDSKFPSAKLCEFWRQNIIKSLQIIGTLSEYQVCREILWMLHVPTQMVLFQEEKGLNFCVRDNISIPSLTITALKGILHPFCNYFSIICELESFGQRLYSNCKKEPPLTYEMYNATLLQNLLEIKSGLVDIEKSIMKQDTCTTLLSISHDLNKYLREIQLLYEVHRSVVDDWQNISNWNCVAKLLSGLYFQIANSDNKDRMYICSNLYLSSLTVYLNIIDLWLSEGRLEDWREEFLVSRNLGESIKDNGSQCEKFIVREVDLVFSTDPLMKLLLHKVCQMGRNIELLVALGRISDLWNTGNDENGIRKSLSDEFHEKFMSELSVYNLHSVEDSTDFGIEKTAVSLTEIHDANMDRNIIRQISIMENPFLTKAFENFLPIDLCEKDAVDGELEFSDKNTQVIEKRRQRLKKISEPIFPITKIIEHTLSTILNTRYSRASKLVKDILTQEYKLEGHLKLMRSVYMMECSHVMNKFCYQLFSEIENNTMWNNASFLTCLLEEALSQKWPESSSRWSVTIGIVRGCTVLQAVDNITLHYAIGWPINMLLNNVTLNKYNSIFRFHLKLKWALWTLSNLRFADFIGSKSAKITDALQQFYTKRLENLRFWLLHAIGSIHSYLCGQVLQSLGYVLENALVQADNLDTIITIHNEYLEKVHEHCLQTGKFDDLMETINNLLEMCLQIREKWKCGSEVLAVQELNLLEKNYVKYHTHLALALHNAIHQNNADYLIHNESKVFSKSRKIFNGNLSELGRNMFTEVAYQSLPPSGMSMPFSLLHLKKTHYQESGSDFRLFNRVSRNIYEEIISYLQFYYYETYSIDVICTANCINNILYSLIEEINMD